MTHFTERGESLSALFERIKKKYGGDVRIVEQRSLPKKGIGGMLGGAMYEISGMYADKESQVRSHTPHTIDGARLQDAIRNIRQEAYHNGAATQQQLQEMQHKINLLIKKIGNESEKSYPELHALEKLLIDNDFNYAFTQSIIREVMGTFTIPEMQKSRKFHTKILQSLSERIQVAHWSDIHTTKINVLVGPTGVGKTTTLAKIAKLLAFGEGTKKIATIGLLTIDNYRLAAKEQLDSYGRLMGAPAQLIRNREELRSALALHEKDDHILIDTIGRSPHEAAKLGQMHELLKGCGAEATYSLVVSATTKMSDLEVIKTHYHPFNFSSVIITKLDETSSIGNIISAFAEGNTPFVYYTDGQSVPLDIKNASKGALLKKISGFNINKSSYEER